MKNYILAIILLITGINLYAQADKPEPSNYFMITSDFSSNTSAFGVVLPEKPQPNILSSATFISKSKFDLSYINVVTFNADTSFSNPTFEHDLMAGYTINLSDDLMLYTAYTRIISGKNSYVFNSFFSDVFQSDFMAYLNHYSASLSCSYMFGNANMFYASLNNALETDVKNFLVKNSSLTLQLGVSLNFSDNNVYNQAKFDSWNTVSFLQFLYDRYPRLIKNVGYETLENGIDELKNRVYNRLNTRHPEVFNSSYGISSVDIYLPIYYSIGNFEVNFSTYVNIPTYENYFYDPETSLILSAGMSYFFSPSGKKASDKH